MKNSTRLLFSNALAHIARLNGVASAVQQFSVEPTIQQRLEQEIQGKADFLGLVNLFIVTELKGETIKMGTRPIASNTDTTVPGARRETKDVSRRNATGYECRKNDFDTRISYGMLDNWAKFPNFAILLRNAIVEQQARDIQTIGFRGKQYAKTSDSNANQMLEDVNIGWLQKIRDAGSKYHISSVEIGAAKEYKNVDALVFDTISSILAPWYRNDSGLRVICSHEFLAKKYVDLINNAGDSINKAANEQLLARQQLGGRQVITPSNFPDDTILITVPKNLSRYVQDGGRRRHLKDSPEINAIENFESSNDDYVVEDMDCVALIEGITQ